MKERGKRAISLLICILQCNLPKMRNADSEICAEGYNTWTFDWTNNGGLQLSDQDDLALPCACGHQGSGTANFYATLSFKDQTMQSIGGHGGEHRVERYRGWCAEDDCV